MSNEKSETTKTRALMLRLPVELHEKVVQRAKADRVSMNTLIVEMVERGLVGTRDYTFAVLRAEMREASARAQEHERNARETREYLAHLAKEYEEMSAEILRSGRDPEQITRANAVRGLVDGTPR